MPEDQWTRDQKILLATLVFVVLTSVAAIIIVPEIRHWFGLESSDGNANQSNTSRNQSNTSRSGETTNANSAANRSGPNTNRPVQSGGITPAPKEQSNDRDPTKLSGLGFSEEAYVTLATSYFRIYLLDIASYDSGDLYLKLRICNRGPSTDTLSKLFIWYTPMDQDSVSWTLQPEKLSAGKLTSLTTHFISLKPGECRVVGEWSEQSNKEFRLKRPLGIVHISRFADSDEESVDLNALDTKGGVRF